MADSEHDEQQAIIRSLNEFKEGAWAAFKGRGFDTLGQAFTAYLLMQLVSAKGVEVTTPPALTAKITRALTPAEELEAAIEVSAKVPVGG